MSDRHLDPTSRATFAHSIEALHEEFRGIFSLETIERFVDESIDRLAGARVVDFIPLFVHRFSRERLRALAQAEGAIINDVPEVLFVCVHNAKGKVHVRSAGSAPADQINPAVVAALDEWGIDLSQEFPKPLTDEFVKAAVWSSPWAAGTPARSTRASATWTGSLRTRPASRSSRCGGSATTSTPGSSSCWPSWSRPRPEGGHARAQPGGPAQHPGRLDVRLRQRLPRRRQLHRHRGLHPGPVAPPGGRLGGVLELHAFAIFGTAVAATVGTGTIDVGQVTTLDVLLAALVGATLFDLITWYYGLPTSSSHALIGGLAGAALAYNGPGMLVAGGITKIALFIVISPLLGLVLAVILMRLAMSVGDALTRST